MLNLETICRLCLLQSHNPIFLINIGPETANLLNSMLRIEFKPTSRLPHKICVVCQKKIIDFCAFLKEAHDNQEKLLDMFLNHKLAVTTNSPIVDYEVNIEREVVINNMDIDSKLDMSIDLFEETNDGIKTIYWNNTFESNPESPPGLGYHENLQMAHLSAHVSTSSVEMQDDGTFPPGIKSSDVEFVYSNVPPTTEDASETSEWTKEYVSNDTLQVIGNTSPSTLNNSILRNHQSDTGKSVNKRSACDICGVWVLNVKQHKKCVHSYEGELKCKLCCQIFQNRLKLYMHVRYKHDPPHYACIICGKMLKSKVSNGFFVSILASLFLNINYSNNFQNQLKEHTYQKHKKGEYLYHCEWCVYKFNYRTSLSHHHKKFHPIQYKKWMEEKRTQRYRPH